MTALIRKTLAVMVAAAGLTTIGYYADADAALANASIVAGAASADLAEVGTTKDACDRSCGVRFATKSGDVVVAAGESKLVELVGYTREVIWYCCGTRERCANDHPFNWVRCERAGNGAIFWTFYAGR